MKDKADLLALLNDVKKSIYGDLTFPFLPHHINYYSKSHFFHTRYYSFNIKKKSRGQRTIHAPTPKLKILQECLNVILQSVIELHPSATGFVAGKSIVDNARLHVGSYYVYNIDLKDFFSSIDQERIFRRLKDAPFFLNMNTGRRELANIIAGLCCHRMEVERRVIWSVNEWQKVYDSVLPQGAPTSPAMSNIICGRLDQLLATLSKEFKLQYTRYADDITFSGFKNVFAPGREFTNELNRIITSQGFIINKSKTRLQKKGFRQEVTGLVVNEKVNVSKSYVKQLRMWLYYWERYGFDKASIYFSSLYDADKGHIKKGTPDLAAVIGGKLDFMKMVKGEQHTTYIQLRARFVKLMLNGSPVIQK